MSAWYNRVVGDLSEIIGAIGHFETELESAKYEVRIKGSLEKASASLPGITENRFGQLQEIEAILEHLNISLRKERSIVFRKFFETYNRQLTSRDAEKYVDGEDSVIDLTHLVNQFALLRNRYLGILKGLDVKQWQIGHITKLRTAGMEDIVID
jgi:ribonuclease BN (tRNA processing enzyme)